MTIKVKTNLWSGIGACIGALVLWFYLIPNFIKVTIPPESASLDPQYMPKFIAIVTFVLGVLLILDSLVFKKEKVITLNLKDELRSLIYCGFLILFAVSLKWIGYLIASIVLCIGTLVFLRAKKWYYYVICLTITVIIYFVFKNYLGIMLP